MTQSPAAKDELHVAHPLQLCKQRYERTTIDVKTGLLCGDLEEDVDIDTPPGYSSESTKGQISKPQIALWICKSLNSDNHIDHTIIFKREGEKVIILIVCVDDFVVTCDV